MNEISIVDVFAGVWLVGALYAFGIHVYIFHLRIRTNDVPGWSLPRMALHGIFMLCTSALVWPWVLQRFFDIQVRVPKIKKVQCL